MTARIRVLDVNDNPPLFAGSSVSSDDVSFSESAPASSFRILPQAQDRDSPSNAVIEYVMTPASDVFELGTPTTESDGNLKLYVTGVLDREAQDQYQFQVSCVCHASPTKVRTISVYILNLLVFISHLCCYYIEIDEIQGM